MSMALAPIVRVIIFVCGPVIHLVNLLVKNVLDLFPFAREAEHSEHNREVLKGAIELHQGPEEETLEQRAMLRSIMDLAEVTVGEVMTHRKNIVMIDGALSIMRVLDEVLKSPFHAPASLAGSPRQYRRRHSYQGVAEGTANPLRPCRACAPFLPAD